MGCFSQMCAISGQPVNSDSEGSGDTVHIFLLQGGVIKERVYGNYDSYGCVYGQKWETDWGLIVDLNFNRNPEDGLCYVLAEFIPDGYMPESITEGDPDQGWGPIKFMRPNVVSTHEVIQVATVRPPTEEELKKLKELEELGRKTAKTIAEAQELLDNLTKQKDIEPDHGFKIGDWAAYNWLDSEGNDLWKIGRIVQTEDVGLMYYFKGDDEHRAGYIPLTSKGVKKLEND